MYFTDGLRHNGDRIIQTFWMPTSSFQSTRLNRAPINGLKNTTPIESMRHLDIKPRQPMQHKGFSRHTPSGMVLKKKGDENSPPFKRHSVGRTYPWQVAPQQSLLPFRINNTKFKSVNYIYNLSKFPATFMLSPGPDVLPHFLSASAVQT